MPIAPVEEYCLLMLPQTWWSCMPKAEWSGWVQAVGSILAILVSVALVQWQFARTLRAQRLATWEAKFGHADEATDLLAGLLTQLRICRDRLQKNLLTQAEVVALKSTCAVAATIDINTLHPAAMRAIVRTAQDSIAAAVHEVDALFESLQRGDRLNVTAVDLAAFDVHTQNGAAVTGLLRWVFKRARPID